MVELPNGEKFCCFNITNIDINTNGKDISSWIEYLQSEEIQEDIKTKTLK